MWFCGKGFFEDCWIFIDLMFLKSFCKKSFEVSVNYVFLIFFIGELGCFVSILVGL